MKKKILWLLVSLIIVVLLGSCTNSSDAVNSNNTILDVKIEDVSFYDANGNKLEPTDNWIPLQADTKIVVTYQGPSDQIDYVFTPTGTQTYNQQQIIGTSPVGLDDTRAELIWTPADDQSLGHINISINLGSYCVRSEYINVIYEK